MKLNVGYASDVKDLIAAESNDIVPKIACVIAKPSHRCHVCG
jgi:hypothetical protein